MIYRIYIKIILGLCVTVIGCAGEKNDNRVVLSSSSANILTIPEGDYEGVRVYAKKLEQKILNHYNDITHISDIQLTSRFYIDEVGWYARGTLFGARFGGFFETSFQVQTTTHGQQQIICETLAYAGDGRFSLRSCGNDQITLGSTPLITVRSIEVPLTPDPNVIN